MLVVVAYDIADDRRRMRLRTRLLGFGNPVQESVFECEVDEPALRRMRRHIVRIVRPGIDRVRLYRLCVGCAARIEDESGDNPAGTPSVIVI